MLKSNAGAALGARRHLTTVATYALAGPPLANGLMVLAGFLVTMVSDAEFRAHPASSIAGLLIVGLIGVPFSYLFGGVQALFVGIACAFWQAYRGPVPLGVALLLSAIAWVGFSLYVRFEGDAGTDLSALMVSPNGGHWLAAHLVAGAGCWWLEKRRNV